MKKNKNLMQVIGTITFSSFKEKEHLMRTLRKKYKNVKLTFSENLIIYEYFIHQKDSLQVY